MKPGKIENVVVYRNEDCFCGWPFNGGFWKFADGELAAGFIRGRCDYTRPETLKHDVADNRYGEQVIVYSKDGGRTWPEDGLVSVYRRPEFDALTKSAPLADDSQISYDPKADGYCLLSGYGIPPSDAPANQFVMVSPDRGKNWSQPVRLREYDFTTLGGRPSYVVRDDGMVLLFGHGRRGASPSIPTIFCSTDGGASWGIMGEIVPTPQLPNAIMPYPLILSDGRIVAAVRRQFPHVQDAYTQVYVSADGGLSWAFLSRVTEVGAPASLTELGDGRVVCVYGYRRRPWGIRARVSADGCATWGEEIVLRDDGGSWDLGYPRTHLRPDGMLVSVYYFNSREDEVQQTGGVRHIAASIWRP